MTPTLKTKLHRAGRRYRDVVDEVLATLAEHHLLDAVRSRLTSDTPVATAFDPRICHPVEVRSYLGDHGRQTTCPGYAAALDHAMAQGWKGWTCDECPGWRKQQRESGARHTHRGSST